MEEKSNYICPVIGIIFLYDKDIITTSGSVDNWGEDKGEWEDWN